MVQKDYIFGDIIRRMAFPFFLFTTVLAALLTLSWLLLVPRLTQVSVGGSVRSMGELEEYTQSLSEDISLLETKRTAFLLPIHHDMYERIKTMKRSRDRFQDLRFELRRVITELIPDNRNAITISGIYFDADTHSAEVRGEVRSVGPRSMTVLARFIEDIQRISFVSEVTSSRFTRKEHPEGGFYSPFTLRILLDNV